MDIFFIEADQVNVDNIRDKWILRQAVVVSINEEAAIQCVVQGLQGAEVFTGPQDEGRYARPQDTGYFNSETCSIVKIGKELRSRRHIGQLRSRIMSWELIGPEPEHHEEEDFAS